MTGGVHLSVSDLRIRYGALWALDGVSLEVDNGEFRAVIGPNGAGKSTLFSVLAGERRPASGAVAIDGSDVTGMSAQRRTRAGVVRTFQVTRILPSLTVLENALVALLAATRANRCFWWPLSRAWHVRAESVLDTVGLRDKGAENAGTLSQGDRKRLEIACALALSPRLLLLDEPTAGMSPEETQSTINLIDGLWRERKITVLLTEHDVAMVFRLAQRITVLHRGAVLCTDTPVEIQKRDDVRQIYLGSA
jgi:branched-chain amino acid transport system ATP-binding protein